MRWLCSTAAQPDHGSGRYRLRGVGHQLRVVPRPHGDYPQMGLGLLPVLASRHRVLMARFEDMSYRSVLARTAKLILELSDFGQHEINRRQHSVDEMSARIGTGREPVSRSLRRLCESGIITCTRSTIVVSDPDALAIQAHVDVMKE